MKRVVQLVSPVRCPFTNITLRPLRNEISSLFPRSRAISLSLSLCPYSNLAKVKLFIKRGIHFKWAGQSAAAYQLNDLIRIQRCDFPFSFVLLFWKGGRWISTTTYLPPRSRYRKESESESVLFDRISTHVVSFHATPSFLWTFTNPAPDTYCIGKNVEWRWSAAVVTLFRRFENATTLRIPKGYSDTPAV